MSIDIEALKKGLLSGSRQSLAKSLTLVESRLYEHRPLAWKLLSSVYSLNTRAERIGITGSPGVGKSTFIESLGKYFLAQGRKLAILAIDPSSPRSHGSILGDKTRMEALSIHPDCFIRPSPSGLSLGGVTRRTREAILLCEAAGFDTILIETVGVGQSETLVSSMVDEFVFLQLPHAGDQLQGIKKGILELADLVVVTKADGAFKLAARQAVLDHELALHLMQADPERLPAKVMMCSALDQVGVGEIFAVLQSNLQLLAKSGQLDRRRQSQREFWFDSELSEQLMDRVLQESPLQKKMAQLRSQVLSGILSPPEAAHQLLSQFTFLT